MKLTALIASALLSQSALATIGESISQATGRLGPARDSYLDRSGRDGAFTWRKDKTETRITFRGGKNVREKITIADERMDFFLKYDAKAFLSRQKPNTWTPGLESGEYISGQTFLHITDGSGSLEITFVPFPPLTLTAEEVKDLPQPEQRAWLNRAKSAITNAQNDRATTEAAEQAQGLHRLNGTILGKFAEGLLIRPAKDSAWPSNVLLTNHPAEADLVDGLEIHCLTKKDGTFQYRSNVGALHTVHRLKYHAPIQK